MSAKAMKLITVPGNGQISIGKTWAGRQVCVETLSKDKILISAGTFVPDSQKTFFNKEAAEVLGQFNAFEKSTPPQATDLEDLFSDLKTKKTKSEK